MVTEDLYRFEQIANSVGNRYSAVQYIALQARKLGIAKRDYHIFESKLIQWVLTGSCPYTESEMERRRIASDYDGLSALLEWVDDKEVNKEVRTLYSESVRNRRLTYCERTDLSKGKVTRVNILLRMAWYSSLK